MSTVYLNGTFLPAEKAMISPLDRGFIFADGVYEVIPVYGGQLFRLDEHLNRLDKSLEGIRLQQPHDKHQWQDILDELIKSNHGGDQSIYLQITRGVAARDHAFPANIAPTVFIMSTPLKPLAEEIKKHGVSAITLEDIRWKHCHLKTVALLPNILLRQQALDEGSAEAILIRNGFVTEGAASNLFIVKNNRIITPPKGPFLLPGITRDLILELAQQNNIANSEAEITPEELQQADEVWLSSSTKEILPVTEIDGKKVGTGQPGPVWKQMIAIYQQYKQSLREQANVA